MSSLAATPPVLRWLLVATAAIWVIGEVRQSVARRPEAAHGSWGSEVVLWLIIAAAALGAGALARATRSATVRPTAIAAWIGLVLFWTGIALRLWSFHTLGRTSRSPSKRAVISR